MVHASESIVGIDEERKLAEEALKAIGILSVLPQSKIPQATIEILRQTCRIAATAETADSTFSSQRALGRARHEVGIVLPPLIRAVEGTLSQDLIDNARRAVEEWKARLTEA